MKLFRAWPLDNTNHVVQLESNMASHLICKILDSQQTNPLFRSPIGENPQNILDVGTGDGEWYVGIISGL